MPEFVELMEITKHHLLETDGETNTMDSRIDGTSRILEVQIPMRAFIATATWVSRMNNLCITGLPIYNFFVGLRRTCGS